MPRTGRPSILTPERQERIIAALANGATRSEAAAYAQIDYATLKRWLRRGRDCAERHAELLEAGGDEIAVLDDPDWSFFLLLAAVTEAESRPTLRSLSTINEAITGEDKALAVRAAMFYLQYAQQRKGLADVSEAVEDEALRAEGFALVEEIRRRERAAAEEESVA